MTEEAMAARGLIRAPIRTKLGNVVLRWVRPDNPNIVREQQAAPAVVQPPPAPAALPDMYQMTQRNAFSCCGAAYFRAKVPAPKERVWTPEEIEAAWSSDASRGRRMYDHYASYANNMHTSQSNRDYYQSVADRYNLEAYTKTKGYMPAAPIDTLPKDVVSYGATVCSDPLPKKRDNVIVKTPGGMYVRIDYPPVNQVTDDVVEALPKPQMTPEDLKGTYSTPGEYPFDDQPDVLMMGGVAGDNRAGAALLRGAKAKGAKPGCRVVAIFNQDQRNGYGKAVPDALARAGFTEVARTGNSNHPHQSTLYIYERVIQEGDFDAL